MLRMSKAWILACAIKLKINQKLLHRASHFNSFPIGTKINNDFMTRKKWLL